MITAKVTKVVVLCLILISICLSICYTEPFYNKITQFDRNDIGGDFIQLLKGKVHYQLNGTGIKGTIVLIGGAGLGYSVWDKNYDYLVDLGYKVLRYDHFGRGYSDRLDNYSLSTFSDQFIELLRELNLEGPLIVIAHSFGAMVILESLNRNEVNLSSLMLISPAGFNPYEPSVLLKTPFVSDFLIDLYWMPRAVEKQMADLYLPDRFPGFRIKIRREKSFAGFKFAQKAFWKDILVLDMRDRVEVIKSIPTLLIWGKYDNRIPISTSEFLMYEINQAELLVIDSVSHHAMYENPIVVNESITQFLAMNPN